MPRLPALALALAGLAGSTAGADEAPDARVAARRAAEAARAALQTLVERARPSVVAVEVRTPGGGVTRRQAVVVETSGWLLLAGPAPGPRDSLVAVLGKDEAQGLMPVAGDAESALTLLKMPAPPASLRALALPEVTPRRPLPAPPVPGEALVMVTSDGAVARGALRAVDRRRRILDGAHGLAVPVTGLLEGALATVAADLGAPWFDAQGDLAGLLVGGLVSEGGQDPADESGVTLRPEPVAAHAVPAAVAAVVWPLLRTEHSVRRARLGLRTDPPSEAVLAQLCPSCGGFVVTAVEPDGPAARAGIEVHDLILAVEGVPLNRATTLPDALLPFRPLDPAKVTVLRRGQRMDFAVILGGR